MTSREEQKESWFEFVDGKPVLHLGTMETKQVTVEEILKEANEAGERVKADSLLASSFLNEQPAVGRDVSPTKAEKIAEAARLRKELEIIQGYIKHVDEAFMEKDDAWLRSLTQRIEEINDAIAKGTK